MKSKAPGYARSSSRNMVATNLAEAGGEGDGLLGGGELGGVGVPRRHGADCEETRRRAAGDGWRRIREASTGRGESSGGGDEERVREEEPSVVHDRAPERAHAPRTRTPAYIWCWCRCGART